MRSNNLIFILLLVLPFLISSTLISEQLVLIKGENSASFTMLKKSAVKLHFKGEGWVLASGLQHDIDIIRKSPTAGEDQSLRLLPGRISRFSGCRERHIPASLQTIQGN